MEAGEIQVTVEDLEARWAVRTASGIQPTEGGGEALLSSLLSEMVVEVVLLQEGKRRGMEPRKADLEREIGALREGDPNGLSATVAGFPGGEAGYLRLVKNAMVRERVEEAVRGELRAQVAGDPSEIARRVKERILSLPKEPVPEVRAVQILLDSAVVAEEARGRILSGEEPARVAREMSRAPEAVRGGDLGWRTLPSMPSFMSEVLGRLPEGRVSEVVRSPYGFHLFVVQERRSGHAPDFDQLQREAAAAAETRAVDGAWARWLTGKMGEGGLRLHPEVMDRVRCCREGRLVWSPPSEESTGGKEGERGDVSGR